MPELKRHFPEAVTDRAHGLDLPTDFDLNDVAYADKVHEAQRQADNEARARGEKPLLSSQLRGKLAAAKQRKEKAWTKQKGAKAVREERRERKEVRRKAETHSKMSEADKAKERELEALISKVRAQNAKAEEDFEGFDD